MPEPTKKGKSLVYVARTNSMQKSWCPDYTGSVQISILCFNSVFLIEGHRFCQLHHFTARLAAC